MAKISIETKDRRVVRRSAVDVNWQEHGDDWGADLSRGDVFNLDCVWYFSTKRDVVKFLTLVDGGMDPRQAVEALESAAPARQGGSLDILHEHW